MSTQLALSRVEYSIDGVMVTSYLPKVWPRVRFPVNASVFFFRSTKFVPHDQVYILHSGRYT